MTSLYATGRRDPDLTLLCVYPLRTVLLDTLRTLAGTHPARIKREELD